jgi:hypothetical protein
MTKQHAGQDHRARVRELAREVAERDAELLRRLGEEVEWRPVDLAQARALVGVLRDLLRLADAAARRAVGLLVFR